MIQCEDLSKNFDGFPAVDGVTLNIQPGQVLAILGQNGAGKTTTVRMLTSILVPSRGWAKVAGYDTVKCPREVRSVVGVLTEMHGLYGRMTGLEYLDFFGQVYNLDKDRRARRSKELLEYFGLTADGDKRTGNYSKGMRQKLALARALIHEPQVLLLDEPTSAMDPESAQLVRQEISRLRSAQRTIIICTHNLTEAEILADTIAIIYHGKILLSGTLDDLRKRLLGPAEFIIKLPYQDSQLNKVISQIEFPIGVNLLEINSDGFRFDVQDPNTANPIVLQKLFEKNIPVVSVQEVQRTLEKIYLKAMSQAAEGIL
ncbi:MAG: ABC transporter ATP-binding protein [Chloroflexota bacterium]